ASTREARLPRLRRPLDRLLREAQPAHLGERDRLPGPRGARSADAAPARRSRRAGRTKRLAEPAAARNRAALAEADLRRDRLRGRQDPVARIGGTARVRRRADDLGALGIRTS